MTESETIKYLSDKRTNFILLFGKPGVGKTCITASLIHYLNTDCEYGKLSKESNSKDIGIWNNMRLAFLSKKLPERTTGTEVFEVEGMFIPEKNRKYLSSLPITFLEVDGQLLKKVGFDEDGKLPPQIELFLKVNNISLTFILVTSHSEAEKDDQLMISFLENLNSTSLQFQNAKMLLLVSKWDSYRNKERENIQGFLQKKMPLTFERLSQGANNYSVFSIGEVIENAEEPILLKYDGRSAKNVFEWVYNALTGQKLV